MSLLNSAEVSSTSSRKRRLPTLSQRRSTTTAKSSFESVDVYVLTAYFDKPARQVQRELGMNEAAFTRALRKAGIVRWPHRRMASMSSAMERFEQLAVVALDDDARALLLHQRSLLENERTFLQCNPEMIAFLTKKRAKSRKVVPLPARFLPLSVAVAPELIATMQRDNRNTKMLVSSSAVGQRNKVKFARKQLVEVDDVAQANEDVEAGSASEDVGNGGGRRRTQRYHCELAHTHDPFCLADNSIKSTLPRLDFKK